MAEATLDQPQETMPVAAQTDQDLGIQPPSELTDQLPEAVDNRTGLSKVVTDFLINQWLSKPCQPLFWLRSLLYVFCFICI